MNYRLWDLLYTKIDDTKPGAQKARDFIDLKRSKKYVCREVSEEEFDRCEDRLQAHERFYEEPLLKAGAESLYFPKPEHFELVRGYLKI